MNPLQRLPNRKQTMTTNADRGINREWRRTRAGQNERRASAEIPGMEMNTVSARSSKDTESTSGHSPGTTTVSGRLRGIRPSKIWWTTLLLALLFFGPLLSSLVPDLSARDEYRITAEHIALTQGPAWIPEDLTRQVFESSGFIDDQLSLHESTLSERIAAAFHTHPWVEKVISVRKSWPAHVQVTVLYRRPIALIRATDGLYPVDRHGILLPASDFSREDLGKYPVIEGIDQAPVGRLGEAWGDPAVTEAARLAEVLMQKEDEGVWWERLRLQGIEIRSTESRKPDTMQFELVTPGGSRILWGRSPSSTHPGELDVHQKLDRLRELHFRYGSFDGPSGPWQIDIRSWQGISRVALQPAESPGSRIR